MIREAVRQLLRVNVTCSAVSLAVMLLLGSWYGRGLCTRRGGGAACAVAYSRPAPRGPPSTAVPPAEERLFGAPLERLRLNDTSVHFEPDAYRRYMVYCGALLHGAASPACVQPQLPRSHRHCASRCAQSHESLTPHEDHRGQCGARVRAPCRHNGDLVHMTDDARAAHYVANGIAESRVARRLRVVATYEAAAGRDLTVLFGGLCNQLYSHVDMLAVLTLMGAEVVRFSFYSCGASRVSVAEPVCNDGILGSPADRTLRLGVGMSPTSWLFSM